jgi:hypothetical protein
MLRQQQPYAGEVRRRRHQGALHTPTIAHRARASSSISARPVVGADRAGAGRVSSGRSTSFSLERTRLTPSDCYFSYQLRPAQRVEGVEACCRC